MIKNSISHSPPPRALPGSVAISLSSLLLLAACARVEQPQDELQGVVELHQRVLAFELPGRLLELRVRRGQKVLAGQPIALLDDGLERPQRDARAADVAATQAQLALLEAGARSEDVKASEAQLRGSQAVEQTLGETARRLRELRAAGTSTPQQLDEAEGQLRRATADREAAAQRLAGLKSGARREDVRAARARAEAARASLALVEARLSRYQLLAPIGGTILDTHAEPGEVLGAGAPVATLGETGRPYVDLFMPEARVAGLQPGRRAAVRVDAEPGRVFAGEVEDVGRRTEFAPRFLFSPKERPNLVVRVRVSLLDPDERLRAGLPAFGRIDREPAPEPGPAGTVPPGPGGEVHGLRPAPAGASGRTP